MNYELRGRKTLLRSVGPGQWNRRGRGVDQGFATIRFATALAPGDPDTIVLP